MTKRARPSRRSAATPRGAVTAEASGADGTADHTRNAPDQYGAHCSAADDNAANGIEALVVHTLALACRVDRASIRRTTRLHDLDADSLTLVAVLARIEASYGIELTADDTLSLFEARDVAALIGALERLIRSHERASSHEGTIREA